LPDSQELHFYVKPALDYIEREMCRRPVTSQTPGQVDELAAGVPVRCKNRQITLMRTSSLRRIRTLVSKSIILGRRLDHRLKGEGDSMQRFVGVFRKAEARRAAGVAVSSRPADVQRHCVC
jgi:hypothetical protein